MKKVITSVFLLLIVFISHSHNGKVDCSMVIKSDILKRDMNYCVYFPESYDESNRVYPVMYLLHGAWDNYKSWVTKGEVHRAAGEMMANGEAPEMIIVMPDGLVDKFYINNYDGSIKWEDFFYEEFIPQIEEKFRIEKDRRFRVIAGLSMGGYGALYHAISHKDMFKACYALSAAVIEVEPETGSASNRDQEFLSNLWGPYGEDGYPENYKKYSIQETFKAMDEYKAPEPFSGTFPIPEITLDCGDDDFLIQQNMNLVSIMKEKKIPVEFRVREGAHTWEYWRTGIRLALKNLGDHIREY